MTNYCRVCNKVFKRKLNVEEHNSTKFHEENLLKFNSRNTSDQHTNAVISSMNMSETMPVSLATGSPVRDVIMGKRLTSQLGKGDKVNSFENPELTEEAKSKILDEWKDEHIDRLVKESYDFIISNGNEYTFSAVKKFIFEKYGRLPPPPIREEIKKRIRDKLEKYNEKIDNDIVINGLIKKFISKLPEKMDYYNINKIKDPLLRSSIEIFKEKMRDELNESSGRRSELMQLIWNQSVNPLYHGKPYTDDLLKKQLFKLAKKLMVPTLIKMQEEEKLIPKKTTFIPLQSLPKSYPLNIPKQRKKAKKEEILDDLISEEKSELQKTALKSSKKKIKIIEDKKESPHPISSQLPIPPPQPSTNIINYVVDDVINNFTYNFDNKFSILEKPYKYSSKIRKPVTDYDLKTESKMVEVAREREIIKYKPITLAEEQKQFKNFINDIKTMGLPLTKEEKMGRIRKVYADVYKRFKNFDTSINKESIPWLKNFIPGPRLKKITEPIDVIITDKPIFKELKQEVFLDSRLDFTWLSNTILNFYYERMYDFMKQVSKISEINVIFDLVGGDQYINDDKIIKQLLLKYQHDPDIRVPLLRIATILTNKFNEQYVSMREENIVGEMKDKIINKIILKEYGDTLLKFFNSEDNFVYWFKIYQKYAEKYIKIKAKITYYTEELGKIKNMTSIPRSFLSNMLHGDLIIYNDINRHAINNRLYFLEDFGFPSKEEASQARETQIKQLKKEAADIKTLKIKQENEKLAKIKADQKRYEDLNIDENDDLAFYQHKMLSEDPLREELGLPKIPKPRLENPYIKIGPLLKNIEIERDMSPTAVFKSKEEQTAEDTKHVFGEEGKTSFFGSDLTDPSLMPSIYGEDIFAESKVHQSRKFFESGFVPVERTVDDEKKSPRREIGVEDVNKEMEKEYRRINFSNLEKVKKYNELIKEQRKLVRDILKNKKEEKELNIIPQPQPLKRQFAMEEFELEELPEADLQPKPLTQKRKFKRPVTKKFKKIPSKIQPPPSRTPPPIPSPTPPPVEMNYLPISSFLTIPDDETANYLETLSIENLNKMSEEIDSYPEVYKKQYLFLEKLIKKTVMDKKMEDDIVEPDMVDFDINDTFKAAIPEPQVFNEKEMEIEEAKDRLKILGLPEENYEYDPFAGEFVDKELKYEEPPEVLYTTELPAEAKQPEKEKSPTPPTPTPTPSPPPPPPPGPPPGDDDDEKKEEEHLDLNGLLTLDEEALEEYLKKLSTAILKNLLQKIKDMPRKQRKKYLEIKEIIEEILEDRGKIELKVASPPVAPPIEQFIQSVSSYPFIIMKHEMGEGERDMVDEDVDVYTGQPYYALREDSGPNNIRFLNELVKKIIEKVSEIPPPDEALIEQKVPIPYRHSSNYIFLFSILVRITESFPNYNFMISSGVAESREHIASEIIYRPLTNEHLQALIQAIKKKEMDPTENYEEELMDGLIHRTKMYIKIINKNIANHNSGGGSFWKYFNKTKLNLDVLGIHKFFNSENYKIPCFIKMLKEAGFSDENLLKSMIVQLRSSRIKQVDLPIIAKDLDIKLVLYKLNKEGTDWCNNRTPKIYNPTGKITINAVLAKNHYLPLLNFDISKYALKNYDDIKDLPDWEKIYRKSRDKYYRNENFKTTHDKDNRADTKDIIKFLLEREDRMEYIPANVIEKISLTLKEEKHYNKLIEPAEHHCEKVKFVNKYNFTENEAQMISNEETIDDYIDNVKFKNRCFNFYKDKEGYTRACIPKQEEGKSTTKKYEFLYMDTETYAFKENEDEGEKIHIPYICNYVTEQGEKFEFKGVNCVKDMFSSLDCARYCVYFHNLKYDMQFLMKHLTDSGYKNDLKICTKENIIYSVNGYFKNVGKKIKPEFLFKDSIKLIPAPLSTFGAMFELDQAKEILAYGMYNDKTVNKKDMSLEYAKKWLVKEKKIKHLDQFINNINKWDLWTNKEKTRFDHIKYSSNYCVIDCDVLRKGIERFRKWMFIITGLDIHDYLTLPSIANDYLIKEGCFNGCYKMSNLARYFIQKCVVGGRCMLSGNKKQRIIKRLQDFDAVSLYPSAMYRMGFLKGKPKLLQEHQLNMKFLKTVDGYFLKIKIYKTGIPRAFPLASQVVNGIRQFKNFDNGEEVYVDRNSLEDLIKHQKIKYVIVQGYYFDQGRNYKIQSVIKRLFNERLEKKKEGNPIQVVYKLLMNAAYGKTIMKANDKQVKIIKNGLNLNKFIVNNIFDIDKVIDIKNSSYSIVEVNCNTNNHFSMPQIGAEILSMSKRIMNEVMCLAEDNKINIYYQDTDSMHIKTEDVDKLGKLFKNKYNRDLIGKNMGQFHTDFNAQDSRNNEVLYSEMFIGIGKKAYIDKLKVRNKKTGETHTEYHTALKGISKSSLLYHCEHVFKISLLEFYDSFIGNSNMSYEIDLCKGKDIFKIKKNFGVATQSSFFRTIKF